MPVSLRVTPEMKEALDRRATLNGRSQSQEAEFRLAMSFERENVLTDALILRYGPRLAGILRVLGEVMCSLGQYSKYLGSDSVERLENWPTDPFAYDQAKKAAMGLLEALAPPGESDGPADKELSRGVWQKMPATAVENFIDALMGRGLHDWSPDLINELRGLLAVKSALTSK